MKTLILNLVTTNAGWLARQLVKYSAVIAAVLTGWLVGRGYSTDEAAVVAGGVASGFLFVTESLLSWIARRYATPQLIVVKDAIDALKKVAPVLCVLCLTSCAGTLAFLASPQGQLIESAAVAIVKDQAKKGEAAVLRVSIDNLTAQIKKYDAQDTSGSVSAQIVTTAKLDGLKVALTACQQQYKGLTGLDYPAAKNPVLVTP